MDIFNRAKVKELEYKLKRAEEEASSLKIRLEHSNAEIMRLLDERKIELPEGCVRGPYCGACTFSEEYRFTTTDCSGWTEMHTDFICKKTETCKHFTQKDVLNND